MGVFLSYAAEDSDWARELVTQLKQRGLDVWDPSVQAFPGDNRALKIGQALEACDAIVVLLSPRAGKTEGLLRTVQYALGSERFQNRLDPGDGKANHEVSLDPKGLTDGTGKSGPSR